MKKLLAIVLATVMLLSLAACGKKKGKTDKKDDGKNETEVIAVEWGEFKTTATTKETVLTTADGSVVTIAPVEYNNEYVDLRVSLLNQAQGPKYLKLAGFAVNGTMLNCDMQFSAQAGQQNSDMFGVAQDLLRINGIFEIAIIDLLFSVSSEEWSTEETVSCQLKSSAADGYKANPNAYFSIINNEQAQKEVELDVRASRDERTSLGDNVYLESQVYVQSPAGDYLLMEVVNEGDKMRNVRINAETVNGLAAEAAGESYVIFPGAKAILSLDVEWAMPGVMRQAFGVSQISNITMYSEVYGCLKDGSIDWESGSQYNNLTFTIPNTSATPDMSGIVIYEENNLKITAKAPVDAYSSDEEKDTYVYLIFENSGSTDLSILEDAEGDTNVSFVNPYFLYYGDIVITYAVAHNMTETFVTIPLTVQDAEDPGRMWDVDLHVPF